MPRVDTVITHASAVSETSRLAAALAAAAIAAAVSSLERTIDWAQKKLQEENAVRVTTARIC